MFAGKFPRERIKSCNHANIPKSTSGKSQNIDLNIRLFSYRDFPFPIIINQIMPTCMFAYFDI